MCHVEQKSDEEITEPPNRPRQNWEEAFRLMAERGDDLLFDGDSALQTAWDHDEWQWD